MSETAVKTKPAKTQKALIDTTDLAKSLASFLPGFSITPTNPVKLRTQSYRVRIDEHGWKSLLSDPTQIQQRHAMLAYLKGLKQINEYAQTNRISLAEAASQLSEKLRVTLEKAWVNILEQNRKKEESVRWCALFFSNMQDSMKSYKGKVYSINASAEEISSDKGRELLDKLLSKFYRRPDPREARSHVVVKGWLGGVQQLKRLSRVTHNHRAMLITDAPDYKDIDQLREAAKEGGLLNQLAGGDIFLRHTVMFGNRGRARHRFQGKYFQEEDDVFIPLAAPYFGMHLDNVVRGFPWKPAIGYRNPLGGIDGVKLDLLLDDQEGYSFFAKNRINPGILLANASDQVVVWGPDALYTPDDGMQIGVAETELRMIRYAEWIVNKYGILDDLEKAEEVVGKKLTRFITDNSGANRMFRTGSRIKVMANHQSRTLEIDFILYFREVAEKALLRMTKAPNKEKQGKIELNKE